MSKKKPYSEVATGKAIRENEVNRRKMVKAAAGAPEWYVELVNKSVDACNSALKLDDFIHVRETAESEPVVRPEVLVYGKKHVALLEKQLKIETQLSNVLRARVELGAAEEAVLVKVIRPRKASKKTVEAEAATSAPRAE